jgi:hypothetical protein
MKPFIKLKVWGDPYCNGVIYALGTDDVSKITYCVSIGVVRMSHETA